MKDKKNFEMAYADDPRGMIKASQQSIVNLLKDIISEMINEYPNRPGLTWKEIEYLLDMAAKKEPKIIFQEGEM